MITLQHNASFTPKAIVLGAGTTNPADWKIVINNAQTVTDLKIKVQAEDVQGDLAGRLRVGNYVYDSGITTARQIFSRTGALGVQKFEIPWSEINLHVVNSSSVTIGENKSRLTWSFEFTP